MQLTFPENTTVLITKGTVIVNPELHGVITIYDQEGYSSGSDGVRRPMKFKVTHNTIPGTLSLPNGEYHLVKVS